MAPPRFGEPGPAQEDPTPGDPTPESRAALLEELSGEARIMLARDVAMARAELHAAARHARTAGSGFGVAVLVGYLALALVAVAASLGLAAVMPAALAFLIVGVVLGIAAGVALSLARKNLEALSPVPHHTIENIKEDISWLRAQMS